MVTAGELVTVEADGDGYLLQVALPLAGRDGIALARSGDDLVLTVDGRRRMLPLPSVLRRCRADGARLAGGRLAVRFVPDPAQWPDQAQWPGPAQGPVP
jgi:arsenite-transporting ATPase